MHITCKSEQTSTSDLKLGKNYILGGFEQLTGKSSHKNSLTR